jgi:hypothetical protein
LDDPEPGKEGGPRRIEARLLECRHEVSLLQIDRSPVEIIGHRDTHRRQSLALPCLGCGMIDLIDLNPPSEGWLTKGKSVQSRAEDNELRHASVSRLR